MRTLLKHAFLSAMSVALVFAVGCGRGGQRSLPQEVPVKGVVTLDEKPLDGAEVVFICADTLESFAGTTDDKGEFKLLSGYGRGTTCRGRCKVTISKYELPAGKTPDPEMSAQLQGGKQIVPPRYSDPDQTQLFIDVPEGGQALTLAISSR